MNAQDRLRRLDELVKFFFPFGAVTAVWAEAKKSAAAQAVEPVVTVGDLTMSLWVMTAVGSWFLAGLLWVWAAQAKTPDTEKIATDVAYRDQLRGQYSQNLRVEVALDRITEASHTKSHLPPDSPHVRAATARLSDAVGALAAAISDAGVEERSKRVHIPLILLAVVLLGSALLLIFGGTAS